MVERYPCGPRVGDCLAVRDRKARSPAPAFGRKGESRAVAAPGTSCADRRESAVISEPPRGFGDPHGGRPGIPSLGGGAGHRGSRTGDSRPTGRFPGHLRGATAVAAAASTGPGLASLERSGVLDTFHHSRRAERPDNEEVEEDRAAPLASAETGTVALVFPEAHGSVVRPLVALAVVLGVLHPGVALSSPSACGLAPSPCIPRTVPQADKRVTRDFQIAQASADVQSTRPSLRNVLGLQVQPLNAEVARQLGERGGEGVGVALVENGSVAEMAGVRPGDVIRQVNRRVLRGVGDFERAMRGIARGDLVRLLIQRGSSSLLLIILEP